MKFVFSLVVAILIVHLYSVYLIFFFLTWAGLSKLTSLSNFLCYLKCFFFGQGVMFKNKSCWTRFVGSCEVCLFHWMTWEGFILGQYVSSVPSVTIKWVLDAVDFFQKRTQFTAYGADAAERKSYNHYVLHLIQFKWPYIYIYLQIQGWLKYRNQQTQHILCSYEWYQCQKVISLN